jgi:hypothetical protein
MEDNGLGSVIFYIILAVIALAGSFKGKKKPVPPKQAMPRRPVQRSEQAVKPAPKVVQPAPPAEMPRRPQYIPIEPVDEGNYADPMAGTFASEGSVSKSMADDFAEEGSMIDKMAAAFASEGISSLSDIQIAEFIHTEISDSEIGDAPVYDYNAPTGRKILSDGFNLKKAVIYSAVLDRKEYSY